MQTAREWTPSEGIGSTWWLPATNTSDVTLIREDEDGTCIQLPTMIFAIGSHDYSLGQAPQRTAGTP